MNSNLRGTLLSMGFDAETVDNTLLITGGESFEAALDYLTKYCTPSTTTNNNTGGEGEKKPPPPEVHIPENPTSLADFGYEYNKDGQLRSIETGEPFKFLNQPHYEAMGAMIVRHIQDKMIKEYGMEEVIVPVEQFPYEMPRSYFFATKDALKNSEVLLCLAHGSGNVRAGQWARKPCFNDDLKIGSVLPYIERAHALGWGVIVFNPNLNSEKIGGRSVDIKFNDSPENHLRYVWDRFIKPSPAKHILFVSHSYGGTATIDLLEKRESEMLARLRALALTDSIHFFKHRNFSRRALEWLATSCIDWVSSSNPLDTPEEKGADCMCVSAGTPKHEHTSGVAVDSVFNFLTARLEIAKAMLES